MNRLSKSLAKLTAAAIVAVSTSAFAGSAKQYLDAAETIDLLEDAGFKDLTLTERISYYDNYKDSHNNKKDNLKSETELSSKMDFLDGPIKLGATFDVGYNYAKDKYDDDDRGFQYGIQPNIGFDVGHKGKLVISLTSKYYTSKIDNASTEKARHQDTDLKVSYDYCPHDHIGVIASTGAGYKWYEKKYDSRTRLTYNASLSPYYKFSEKLRTGVETTLSRSKYKKSKYYNDSYNVTIDSFVDYRMTNEFTTHLAVGASKSFYEGEAEDLNGDREWIPIYTINFDYKAYENLNFFLDSTIENDDSSNIRGGRREWNNSIGADWEISPKITLSQSIGFDREDEINSSYDNDTYSYDIKLDYKFSPKISAFVGWQHDDCRYKYVHNTNYRSNEYYIGMNWHF